MDDQEVEALGSFDHDGARRRGDRFPVSKSHAEALRRAGLVRILTAEGSTADPSGAAGGKSSASPAARASASKTVPARKRGAVKPPGAPSS